ncbi:MAG TPA: exodeoxyribonuclease VII large subunit, partial [Alicycliphilus sp.]|nr:exodeoxyribonuclease VII large subunit [Alicycliphilus sp.]
MFERPDAGLAPRIWEVGALCRAIADALQARFNPVAVRGEITGFSRASSGHCYFTLKDGQGQIRCAMFRRAASGLDFMPRDGELVEVRGQLGVYEARGDLQLIVEGMRRAGQGALFEQFLRLKAQLEAEGLFTAARKRPLPAMPRGIGLVTSPGAAALHDVVTALRRRVPHIPVVLVPALVQGAQAPASICDALSKLYLLAQKGRASEADLPKNSEMPFIDVILLVRGGGSIEDLWAFNDERLARTIVQSPVPLVSGVGHETDFTIADFCADLRAPTPTAA